jgi:hypothetical protein
LNAKSLCRASDVPFVGDGDDVAEMSQFHCHTLSGRTLDLLYHGQVPGKYVVSHTISGR